MLTNIYYNTISNDYGRSGVNLMFIDLLFATATLLFVCADVKQVHKLYKVKEVNELSFTHYKLKIIALVLMIIGYTLSALYLFKPLVVPTHNCILLSTNKVDILL